MSKRKSDKRKNILTHEVKNESLELHQNIFDVNDPCDDEISMMQSSEKAIIFTIDYAVQCGDITKEEGYEIRKIFYDKFPVLFEL